MLTIRWATRLRPRGALDSFGTYVYNSFSEPTSFTDSLSNVTSWTYDTHGNMLTKTDPLGNVTTWTYDSLGRPLTMTLPDPDGAGPLAAPEYQYMYDSYERLITITNPDATTQNFTYDSDDRPLTIEDENSHVTTAAYDVLGRDERNRRGQRRDFNHLRQGWPGADDDRCDGQRDDERLQLPRRIDAARRFPTRTAPDR